MFFHASGFVSVSLIVFTKLYKNLLICILLFTLWQTDAEVRSPRETAVFRNIRTPKIIKDMWWLDSPAEMALSAMSLSSQPASCAASFDRVKTWKDQAIEVGLLSYLFLFGLYICYCTDIEKAFTITGVCCKGKHYNV